MSNEDFEKVELTEEEVKEAIRDFKIKKYFKEKNADYWKQKEAEKPKPKKPFTPPTNSPEKRW